MFSFMYSQNIQGQADVIFTRKMSECYDWAKNAASNSYAEILQALGDSTGNPFQESGFKPLALVCCYIWIHK